MSIDLSDDKQLTVASEGGPIAFALTDAQFEKALSVITPPKPTKPNLWRNEAFSEKMVEVAAYLESVQYVRPTGTCFALTMISNHFDNVILEENPELESFSVDEWFSDTRGEIPEALKDWDPKGTEPMPQMDLEVDWFQALTDAELQFPGFVTLFANCINLEEKTFQRTQTRKHGAMTTFGGHEGTKMPESRVGQGAFDNFRPSTLLNQSSAPAFRGSGLL